MERRGKDGAFRVNTLHLLARPARDKESKRATGREEQTARGGGGGCAELELSSGRLMMRSVHRLKPLPITQQRVSQSDETGKKTKTKNKRRRIRTGSEGERGQRQRAAGTQAEAEEEEEGAVVGGAPPADDGRARDCSTCTLMGHTEATHEQHGGLTDARSSRNIHRSRLGFRLTTSIIYLFHPQSCIK